MRTALLSANTSWYLYNYRRTTISALQERGFAVVCLAPEDDYSEKLRNESGVTFRHLVMDNKGSNPVRDAALILRLLQLYREIRPAVILHFTIKNNLYGTAAARLLGIPAINNISGLGTAFLQPGITQTIARVLYRITQPFAATVFCQNSEDLAQLQREQLVPAQTLQLIPGSGVDLQRFAPRTAPRADADRFRFLFLGRMLRDKGLDELVSAFSRLRETHNSELSLVGFSDAENQSAIGAEQLAHWASLPGIRWERATNQPEEKLAQADCLVLPSYREGLPRSLLEAGAMGIPVITCDVPGCREVVKHGRNGLLCAPANSDSLFEALQTMITMAPGQRAAMGREGHQQVVERFDERIVVGAYLEAVERALQ